MGVIVGKYLDIELMRILAAFFVIYNHTGTTAFRLFTLYDVHTLSYWGCLFGAVFCKFSVPLFFMISGALLLDRKEEPVKIWMRRVIHIFCILLIWSFFYYLNEVAIGKETFVIKHFLSRVYAKDWNFFLLVFVRVLGVSPFASVASPIRTKSDEPGVSLSVSSVCRLHDGHPERAVSAVSWETRIKRKYFRGMAGGEYCDFPAGGLRLAA